MTAFEIVTFIALPILLALVIYGSIKKNRWGMTLKVPNCPRCGKAAKFFRAPKSFTQALWGGYTCPECGCEMDKYGREMPK
jgi:hypothetical protein